MNRSRVAILTGPTASGKTAIALELASRAGNIEIINADSMLVYREMDIGTAKPTPTELTAVPHHLINIRNPDEPYTAGDFVRDVEAAIEEIHQRGHRALIVGGTGFYLKALLYGLWDVGSSSQEDQRRCREQLEALSNEVLFQKLQNQDPESAARIGTNDRYRLIRANELIQLSGKTPSELEQETSKAMDPRFALWVIDREDSELQRRISQRTGAMIETGIIPEVERIRERYPAARALKAVGYRQTCRFLDDVPPPGRKPASGLAGLQAEIELATRQLVKRQRTWFRGQAEAQWFILEQDRVRLKAAFSEIYGD